MMPMNPVPPVVLTQLSDLISFVRNVDQVAQLVADLQAATDANNASLRDRIGADSVDAYRANEEAKIQELRVQVQADLDAAAAARAEAESIRDATRATLDRVRLAAGA